MKTNRIRLIVLLLFSVLLCSCQGPDPIRLRAERANHKLAARCAEGWFTGLPATEHDKLLVNKAFDDWDRALKAEEALLQWPVGGAK